MTRHTLVKILVLVLSISILSAGLAPANPSCNAACCLKPKSDAPHTNGHTPPADFLADCCSGLETAPCPHMLESSNDIKEYAIAAVATDLNPATVKLVVVASNTILNQQPHLYVAAATGPPIRGPGVPLYLQNLSLLI